MKSVLVVDDSALMRLTIKTVLERNGFEIVGEAENGLQGVEKYKALKPDFVTLDISMPKMTGLEALKVIMNFDPEANIIMISAMGQDILIQEAVSNGAKSFIVKPFQEEYIIEVFKQIIKVHE